MTTRLVVSAPDGVGEVAQGDDLTALVVAHCELADGDVLTVTSKVVSKAEGRLLAGDRETSLARETRHVVARRGATTIVRNRLGLTMAAAGIDASNVPAGHHLLLPVDPDASARRLREEVAAATGHNVAVVVTDTAGRAWRTGQTDIAVGAAGLLVLDDHAGRTDPHGNPLVVTAPAVADEIAAAAELATGKLGGRPFAVVRGRADLVLPPGEHGSGAAALVRAEGEDLFGLGAREAVLRALAGRDAVLFGAPAPAADVATAVHAALDLDARPEADGAVSAATGHAAYDALEARARVLAHAVGWRLEPATDADGERVLRLRPPTP